MRKKQGLRIVSSILAASMALTMMPTAAFAAGTAGTSNAENSVVVQSVGSEDTLTTLEFENDIPTSSGSEAEGWTYTAGTGTNGVLVIYANAVFDRPGQTVNCNVTNFGEIKDGVFTQYVMNEKDNDEIGVISGGTFEDGMVNYGIVKGGTLSDFTVNGTKNNADANLTGGIIENCTMDGTLKNYGTIKNGFYNGVTNQGTIENGVFSAVWNNDNGVKGTIKGGIFAQIDEVENGKLLKLENALYGQYSISGLEHLNEEEVTVVGNPEVTVTYTADSKYFDGWKANPEVNWTESTDKKTVTFNMPDTDVTLTAKEKVVELTFADGKPTEEGNKTSGWSYEDDVLTFYEGYSFNQDVIVNCSVENYGTITAGTFKQDVDNAGTITNGLFATGVNNYIREWVSDGETYNTVYHNGTITGGVFAYIGEYGESGIKLPDNTHTLSAVGSMINDEILMAAYVIGDNQKVKVSYFGSESDFESWKGAEDLNVTPTETTIEFVMPAKDVALGINYKDNALEFGADGMPTHAGGKNWECVQSGEEAVLMMYDGAVLDTAGTVKAMVVAYPGSIIRNGTFENTVITYGGVIENGIFNEQVTSGGTIQNGTFNDTVANMNIKMDKPLDSGNINLGINVDISECAGLITGGTFHKDVQNCGIIEGGSFVGAVYCIPLAEMIGKELEQQGITFTSVTRISGGKFAGEVYNAGEITGGQFSAEVTNIGTIENGLFSGALQNTTSANLTESMSDGAVATMALFGDAAYAVEMQNSASAEKTYIGTIKDGNFANTVTNNGGQITGGVFWNKIEGDAVANVHTLTANDSHIGAGNLDASGSRAVTRDQVYTVGKECVYVSYAGTIDFGSWKTNDVDLSTAAGMKSVIFTMPGDKDVTLTASTEQLKPSEPEQPTTPDQPSEPEKPAEDDKTTTIDKDTKLDEDKTYKEDFKNEGTISKGQFTGEVTNNNTIEGGTFEGNVSNDEKGKISDGEFKAAVQNAGTIENGKFADVVTNNETGKIADGEFTGKVENKGTIQNGTFTDTVTNDGTIENGKFAGEVKGTGTINGGTFQKVSEAAAINGGVFGAESSLKNAKITPSALKIETGIADGSVVNDVIGGGAAVAMLALFEENDVATQAADAAETVAYVVGDQTLTVKYSGSDKSFDKWDTTGLTDAKLSADGKTITFKMNRDVTLKAVAKKSDSGNTDKPADKPNEQPAKNDSGAGALIVGGVLVAGGVATGVLVYKLAVEYIQAGLPEGAAIPETREQLAVALWQKAGQPEVAVEEGVTLTDTEKAMRWAVENQLISAAGEDSVSKIDVLLAVYKASKL